MDARLLIATLGCALASASGIATARDIPTVNDCRDTSVQSPAIKPQNAQVKCGERQPDSYTRNGEPIYKQPAISGAVIHQTKTTTVVTTGPDGRDQVMDVQTEQAEMAP
jgi:hypothetical protein